MDQAKNKNKTKPAGRTPSKTGAMATVRRFVRHEKGAIAVMFALTLPALVGSVGLGVEAGSWYVAKREIQNQADTAAVAASFEVMTNQPYGIIKQASLQEASRNGNNPLTDTIAINMPPTSGSYTANSTAVEVIVQRPIETLFSKIFLGDTVTTRVRAVTVLTESSRACVLALDPTASGSISNVGTTTIQLNGCSIAANSSSGSAMSVSGSSYMSTECASIVGDYSLSGLADLNVACGEAATGMRPVDDPYADLEPPVPASCDHNSYTASTGTIYPGTYCNGLNFSGNVEMASGTYIVDRGTFKVNAGATLTSAFGGVTIILTSSTGSNYADVSINGGAAVTLEAQASGPYAGMVFFQDRNAPSNNTNNLNGGANLHLTGVIYFPNQDVMYTGGATTGTGDCTQIVGRTVTFNGNANLNNDCPFANIRPISVLNKVGLVE